MEPTRTLNSTQPAGLSRSEKAALLTAVVVAAMVVAWFGALFFYRRTAEPLAAAPVTIVQTDTKTKTETQTQVQTATIASPVTKLVSADPRTATVTITEPAQAESQTAISDEIGFTAAEPGVNICTHGQANVRATAAFDASGHLLGSSAQRFDAEGNVVTQPGAFVKIHGDGLEWGLGSAQTRGLIVTDQAGQTTQYKAFPSQLSYRQAQQPPAMVIICGQAS